MAAPEDSVFLYPVRGQDEAALYALNEGGAGGYYPVGVNDYWHGGVHFKFTGPEPLQAVADGVLAAYRFDEEPTPFEVQEYVKDHPGAADYSRSFVLLKHEHVTPMGKDFVFYALYMHLCSKKEMGGLPLPSMFQKRWRVLGSKGSAVDLLNDPADPKSHVGNVPVGGYLAKLGETPTHYQVRYRGTQHFKGYALLPKGFNPKKIRVKNGTKWDPVKLPIYDGDDRSKLVGYLRTPEGDDYAKASLVASKVPDPKPPPAPPAKKGEAPKPPPSPRAPPPTIS